jgi:hypothetical protein
MLAAKQQSWQGAVSVSALQVLESSALLLSEVTSSRAGTMAEDQSLGGTLLCLVCRSDGAVELAQCGICVWSWPCG